MEDFTRICNLLFIEKDYDQIDPKGNKFNFDTLSHSLLIDPSSSIQYPFNVEFFYPNVRLIHYTMSHILFPRKGNCSAVQKLGIPVVWFLENKVLKNWANAFLTHMLERT